MPHSSASRSWDRPFSKRNRRTNSPNLNANSSLAMGTESRSVYNRGLHTIDVMHGKLQGGAERPGKEYLDAGVGGQGCWARVQDERRSREVAERTRARGLGARCRPSQR